MKSRLSGVTKLKRYFAKRPGVAMAFLFGSHAAGRAHSGSDWDIGVYFVPPSRDELEYEETDREYPQEKQIWTDLTRILGTESVDLVVLNRAPASVADSAIRGEPLAVNDRGLWLRFMLTITSLAEDFREFARDYHDIYQRSASLAPNDAERLRRIMEFLESQMTLYEKFSGLSLAEFESDLVQRGAVERWVENVVNAVTDISKIVLSSRKKTMPYGYADTVRRAGVELGLSKEFWDAFLEWVKLRNILAHEYLDIKWKRISSFIRESEPHLREFFDAAHTFLQGEK